MTSESLVGGGVLVRVHGGSGLAVERVPGARRGLVVTSASVHAVTSERQESARYRLTRRAVAGTDLWRVRPDGAAVVAGAACATEDSL